MKKLREIWNTIFDNEKDRRLMTAGVIALVGICLLFWRSVRWSEAVRSLR
ncbi:MAG: hypothetical protein V8R46_10260 [Eubacterium ramulus]